jgi:hypothetical protein
MARDQDQAVFDRKQQAIRDDLEVFMKQAVGRKPKGNIWMDI